MNQSAPSTCHVQVRWYGNSRHGSVSTESWPACWWQWSWSVGRSSYQDRSWRRMCSSRSVTWSLVSQTQSPLQEGCTQFYYSSILSQNERWPEKKRKARLRITHWVPHCQEDCIQLCLSSNRSYNERFADEKKINTNYNYLMGLPGPRFYI